jgi:hypothetical protein
MADAGGVAARARFLPLAFSVANAGTPANLNETVLKSFLIAANLLNVDGKRLRVRYWGFCANNANTKTIRVRIGPVTLTGTIVFASIGSPYQNLNWRLDIDIVRRVVDSQDCTSMFIADGEATIARSLQGDFLAAANDDAADMLLELTGQNGVAAANDIVCQGHLVELADAP